MENLALGIVDDDEETLYTVQTMMETLGWRIHTTADPWKAIGWVQQNAIDILMVDYHMPIMSGLEVIRRVRRISDQIVLLALTVDESSDVAHELLTAGADDLVLKPLRITDFSARITLHTELFRYRTYGQSVSVQKGLSESTARRIYKLFGDNPTMTVLEVVERSGLAYPTVYRYLEYLVKKGQLSRKAVSEDGRVGRPKIVYSSLLLERDSEPCGI